ncbi:DUF4124 domain-containing protein [Dokdonella immobilis]|uniref:DUF4124 domain-containing protein n=1 Tax=Dokdonella immobilis TaxID=578942 RepID=A0A1I5AN64_9GAMM|nr:DUF4124 domain-containing protein [Dokdonella immobilis]SFN63868.1 protein of unknown function [Dokdonella immobilis]
MTIFRLTSILLLSVVAASALAAGSVRYKWRDAEGNLHYTDSLPADAGVRGYEVINAQGIVVKRVEPAKTPEQRREAKVAADAARAEKDAAERQQRADQQLLAANPTEKDLIETHRQQLEMIDLQLSSQHATLESLERSLTDLLGRAAALERSDRPVPAKLAGQIGDLRRNIETQHALIERRKVERESTVKDFAKELDHYRALREKYGQH